VPGWRILYWNWLGIRADGVDAAVLRLDALAATYHPAPWAHAAADCLNVSYTARKYAKNFFSAACSFWML
jgi:hypothetical protein